MKALFKDAESLDSVPESPGVYLFYNHSGDIIYVGKAKRLLKRLQNYKRRQTQDPKTEQLKRSIIEFEIIQTASESDALILERQLIKYHQPRYNILLKDDKNFIYIKITNDIFPKIELVRNRFKDGAHYFGPYPSIGSSKRLKRVLQDVFPLRDCDQHISLDTKEPKCINLDIGKCIGPCIYKHVKGEYDALINKIKSFLLGHMDILNELREEMLAYSDAEAFEKAAEVKERIEALDKLHQQRCLYDSDESILMMSYTENQDFHYLGLQHINEGILISQKGLYLEKSSNPSILEDMVLDAFKYYNDTIDEVWTSESEISAKIIPHPNCKHPQRGLKRDLLENTIINTKTSLYRLSKQREPKVSQDSLLETVQSICKLNKLPYRIVGFDISHYYGKEIVASAITFINGKPSKKDYRKFNIRSVKGKSNDVASMYEVVLRYLNHCKPGPFPDLLLIDGGMTQLSAARQAIQELADIPNIKSISLAKKEEVLFLEPNEKPVELGRAHPVCQLFQRIRDEAHRFALKFQREKRHQSFFNSQLRSIEGVGKKRAEILEKTFKSVDNIKSQDAETLAKLPGINLALAQKILLILK